MKRTFSVLIAALFLAAPLAHAKAKKKKHKPHKPARQEEAYIAPSASEREPSAYEGEDSTEADIETEENHILLEPAGTSVADEDIEI